MYISALGVGAQSNQNAGGRKMTTAGLAIEVAH